MKKSGFQPECSICDMTFASLEAFSRHCNEKHIFKCYRCGEKWSSKDLLQKHFHDEHKDEKEECQMCDETVRAFPFLAHLCICTVGSYASLCIRPSVCPDSTQIQTRE